jgi:hypothetical protein
MLHTTILAKYLLVLIHSSQLAAAYYAVRDQYVLRPREFATNMLLRRTFNM